MTKRPDYWRDLYGDGTISWVPPVINYVYNENLNKRGIDNRKFRWEEVSIDLDTVQPEAVLDYIMPDSYMLQITPDIGWHDLTAMFGESKDPNINNPHLKNLGPFSITGGRLVQNGENSVTLELTEEEINSAVINGFASYLWRAVPYTEGNPGLGGIPVAFEWISTVDQLFFTVDPFEKEVRKTTQEISGTKSSRVSIFIEANNSPAVFVEEESTSWKITFSIDRPLIEFRILAKDEGGSAFTFKDINISYDRLPYTEGHVWNNFDSFALLAGVSRLPDETNDNIRKRTIDSFVNKGGSHYIGLINSINRNLGLSKKEEGIVVSRKSDGYGSYNEPEISLIVAPMSIEVFTNSFVIHDEALIVDSYTSTITTEKDIVEILDISANNGTRIDPNNYHIIEDDNILYKNKVKLNVQYDIVKVTYKFKKTISYKDYATIGSIVKALNEIENQFGVSILDSRVGSTVSGSESSKRLILGSYIVNQNSQISNIGVSSIGLFSVTDLEYKWSFADKGSMFFNSEYYKFVLELKSQTNIEWGFVTADKDVWDAVDSNIYGHDSLPTVFDIELSKYGTSTIMFNRSIFDPWEAFRMSYYYNGNLLKNTGFSQASFKSGVGYKQDCLVTIHDSNISRPYPVNNNPITLDSPPTSIPNDILNGVIIQI